MEDHFGIFVADVYGRMVVIAINIPAGAPLLPPRIVHRLRSLAAHLTSGVRLRSALGATRDDTGGAPASPATPEAVFDPAGHALDASGPARDRATRETLGGAVRLMEKARGCLRRVDPDEALQLWRGLVDGTWSLVEHHESDGKRYLLARRNQPGVREPTALTRHERSVLAFAAMGHQTPRAASSSAPSLPSFSRRRSSPPPRRPMTNRIRETAVRRESDSPGIGPPAGLVAWHLDLGDGHELALFEFATSDGCPRAAGVTAAERVVLGLAVAGLSNAEIAARRGVSPRTVANQIANLFRKLGVHSRLELQAWLAGVRGR